ncbi:MAG: hypothetical protein LBP76_14460 [Treponema sp.]|jgi:hypothetical protein|nr:hypothetical protein [Treponema sp.]
MTAFTLSVRKLGRVLSKGLFYTAAGMFGLYLASCDLFHAPPENSPAPKDASYKIDFGGNPQQSITLKNLSGKGVFLVAVNTGGTMADAAGIGGAYSVSTGRSIADGVETGPVRPLPAREDALVSGFFLGEDGTLTRLDHPGAREFSRNPPAPPPVNRNGRSSQGPAFSSYTVGAGKDFWVQKDSQSKDSQNSENWEHIHAVLRASSTHANIWIRDLNYNDSGGNDNQLSKIQAETIARKFDQIYQYDTAIFGYEYGGNPNGGPYGGVDGDPKIQILVYDIDNDYKAGQTSGIFGYFWGKDYLSGTYSNNSEMFYIDSYFASKYPEAIYSTLVHEFQHMINFNVKYIEKHILSDTDTWYDEMLSMLAEDMIAPLIGIGSSDWNHPIRNRIPLFLSTYWYTGPTEWLDGGNLLFSYSNTYAFGAYLARNYGGAELVKEIARNDKVGIASVDAALQQHGSSWNNAVSKYGEAFIFSGSGKPSDRASFDNTVTKKIAGHDYTFAAFDIWKLPNQNRTYFEGADDSWGPAVFPVDYRGGIPPYSALVRSQSQWLKVNGDITITLNRPDNPQVELFLMTR